MSRFARKVIDTSKTGWNADAEDNFRNMFDLPYPLARYANMAALPAANAYDHCLCVVQDYDGNGNPMLMWSTGSAWVPVMGDGGYWGGPSPGTKGASSSGYMNMQGGLSTQWRGVLYPWDTVLEKMVVVGSSVTGTVTFEVWSGGSIYDASSTFDLTSSTAAAKDLYLEVPAFTHLQLHWATAAASGVTDPTMWLMQRRRY